MMRRHAGVVVAGAVCSMLLSGVYAAAGAQAAAGARTGALSGTWGTAQEVPGTAALNKGGNGGATSVSCASAGDCSAGGSYTDGSGHFLAFVVTETNGAWDTAEKVPGVVNQGGTVVINSMSCGSAGNCSSGGSYIAVSGASPAFVVNQVNGVWGTAEKVRGTLNQGRGASISSVSCALAGNCSAGGSSSQALVVTEKNGGWSTARQVPGIVTLDNGRRSQVNSVSCASAGNCGAGGVYANRSGQQVFVVDQTDGRWGTAQKVPGTAALNKGGNAQVNSVSCGSAGNCSAGGYYTDGSGHPQAFIVTETNGRWGTAQEVPGAAALNQGGNADVSSVSCGSAGNCSAGGSYTDGSGHFQTFVAAQKNGVWGTAKQVPGTAALNRGGNADLSSVSCGSAGNCSAGGSYTDGSGRQQVFVVTETNGRWGTAQEVPGAAALNKGGFADILSVSCAPAGKCSAGGNYYDASHHLQAFVVSQTRR